MHYYKFNIPTWTLSTAHLSLVEEAVYFRLVNHYYDTEQPIPLETQSVIRRLRLGTHEETVALILAEYFTETKKGFVHSHCEEILNEYAKTTGKNRENGKKGGRPKKNKDLAETQEKPTGLISETQTEPRHNPNQEPITINHNPIPITHNPIESAADAPPPPPVDKPASKSKGTRIAVDWQLPADWLAWANADYPGVDAVREADKFADFWRAKAGADACKVDWLATWRNWIRRASEFKPTGRQQRHNDFENRDYSAGVGHDGSF